MKIISRTEAKSLGLKRFFTGKPCIRGHLAERIVSNKACVECAKIRDKAYKDSHKELLRAKSQARNESNKEYSRQYYLDNKQKYKDRSDKRYREKKEEILALQRRRFIENPGLNAEKNLRYRKKHPDRVVEIMRNHYIKNRKSILERHRENYRRDPSKAAAKVSLRRSRKVNAVPAWFGEFDAFVWREAADLVRRRETATRVAWAADHMIPIVGRNACGLHVWNNCQVIPESLNLFKHNKLIMTERLEWLGFLKQKKTLF